MRVRMDESQWIGVRSPEFRAISERIKVATRLSSKLNISIGRAVFIGYECMFTGHGTIDIADEVMIANKVNLVTAGHPVEPDKRRAYITVEPITVERNVWIGTTATVLPGVTVGADSVVAAGAVVTHDVPPATLVAGVPATVIRHL
jgi:acetyltransferase-like isoleucine patch superfamily enzyme